MNKQPFQVGDKVLYQGDFFDGRDARDAVVLGVRVYQDKYWQVSTTANSNWLSVNFYEERKRVFR